MPPTQWINQTDQQPTTEWDDGDTQWDESGNVSETLWDPAPVTTTWTEVE